MKLTTYQRQERFERYRPLWDRLCVLGSKLRTDLATAIRADLEAQYDAVLAQIRERQAAFAAELAARLARKAVPA